MISRIWRERWYWMWPVALTVLLVVFLVQRLWVDSIIIGVFLAGFLGFAAHVRDQERNLLDKIKRYKEEAGE